MTDFVSTIVCHGCGVKQWDIEGAGHGHRPRVGDVGLCSNCMTWFEIADANGRTVAYEPTPEDIELAMAHLPEQLRKRGRL